MPSNRTLAVTVTFSCTHNVNDNSYGGTATYAQTSCNPSDMGQLVDSDGSIHLDRATDPPAGFNQNVDIYFTLASPCVVTPGGGTLPVAWATQYGPGMVITVPEGGSASEFNVITNEAEPNVILVEDKDDDSNTYNYKPFVQLTSVGNYRIGLDPQIVNRPKTNR
jgi:hypothetical protein